MRAIKKARNIIATEPASPVAQVLSTLVLALESKEKFSLEELYTLDYDSFELCLEILREWRLDRYYAGKSKLIDLSMQVSEARAQPQSA